MSQNNLINMHRNYSNGYISSSSNGTSSRNSSSMHKAHSVNSFNLSTSSSSNNNNNSHHPSSGRSSRSNNGNNGSSNNVSYNHNHNSISSNSNNVLSMTNYQYLEDAIKNGKYRTNLQKQANNLGNLMHSYNTFKVVHSKNNDEQYSTKNNSNSNNSSSNHSSSHHKSSHSSNHKSISPNEHKNSNQIPLIIAQESPDATLGLQRSFSAQNIQYDPRLADKERSLNYTIRMAINGLNKAHMGANPPTNKSLQSGDFGDDAGMITENPKCIVIGLCDGAGGNRSIGIDPKIFSNTLLANCVDIVKKNEVQPHQVAKLAMLAVHCLEKKNVVGSGTLVLLMLNKETNIMTALNMGDSGFRLIRNKMIHHKSTATMAGSSPRQIYVSESMFTGISFVDEKEIARDSDMRQFRVKKDDIIILSSDGLFDVLKDSDIEKVVNNHDIMDLQGIADELLTLTMRSYVFSHRDDILIMVCRVDSK